MPAPAKIIAVAIVLVAVAGWWAWRPSGTIEQSFTGYVEAEYVWIASPIGGTLTNVYVRRGENVPRGKQLFAIDDIAERGAWDEAMGHLRESQADLADLLTGRRPPEIDTIVAQLAQAKAALQRSESDYQRQSHLQPSGGASTQQLEQALAQRDQDLGRTNELTAQLQVARLPGRDEQINAAKGLVIAAKATLKQAQWRLDQKMGFAPGDALVFDTLYRPGETVGAGVPIIQLLPPENIKIRFFVPEAMVARVSTGTTVSVICDGCAAPVTSVITFISPQAEFTPPVIYSREQRTRLVFMVEARPIGHPDLFRVGQPVDVSVVSR